MFISTLASLGLGYGLGIVGYIIVRHGKTLWQDRSRRRRLILPAAAFTAGIAILSVIVATYEA